MLNLNFTRIKLNFKEFNQWYETLVQPNEAIKLKNKAELLGEY